MRKELVTIGLVTYNGEKYIRRALESLTGQTYENFELIISDDISQDKTFEICAEFAARDPRIKLIKQKERLGQLKNFRFVAQKASGEYFMWAAQDDWWHQEFISALKRVLDGNKGCGVAMGSYERVWEDGSLYNNMVYDGRNDISAMTRKEVLGLVLSKYQIQKFYYGLFRAPIIMALCERPFPACKSHDRVLVAEAALGTKFCSVPDVLYKITTYKKNLHERHGNQDVGKFYYEQKKQTRYVFTMVGRLISSPAASWSKKLKILPVVLPKFIWQNRVFLREWFPRTFDLALKTKKTWKGKNHVF